MFAIQAGCLGLAYRPESVGARGVIDMVDGRDVPFYILVYAVGFLLLLTILVIVGFFLGG